MAFDAISFPSVNIAWSTSLINWLSSIPDAANSSQQLRKLTKEQVLYIPGIGCKNSDTSTFEPVCKVGGKDNIGRLRPRVGSPRIVNLSILSSHIRELRYPTHTRNQRYTWKL